MNRFHPLFGGAADGSDRRATTEFDEVDGASQGIKVP
jgi:hypothetical protein